MNFVYSLVWKTATKGWVVASEYARRHCNSGARKLVRYATRIMGCFSSLSLGFVVCCQARGGDGFPFVVTGPLTESHVTHDYPNAAAVYVNSGGIYTGYSVLINSYAREGGLEGGIQGALYVADGGIVNLDEFSAVSIEPATPPDLCCAFGMVVRGTGEVNSSAKVSGVTGGAAVFGGGRLNLNGGTYTGLFGIAASGEGSIVEGSTYAAGTEAGAGVLAERGASITLDSGSKVENGMVARDPGSTITARSVATTGEIRAVNGAAIVLDGGTVDAEGWGVAAVTARGVVPSHITTSADITVTGFGNATALKATEGGVIDLVGGTVVGAGQALLATGPGSVIRMSEAVVQQSEIQGSRAVSALDGASVELASGQIIAPYWNNIALEANGGNSVIRNTAATITGSNATGARASNGGTYLLASGGTMFGSDTALEAMGTGSSIVSSGNVSAVKTVARATDGGLVIFDGGDLTTTGATDSAIVADNQGEVKVTNSEVLAGARLSGNGIEAREGGKVSLTGGTLTLSGNGSSALIIQGQDSKLTSNAPLFLNSTAAEGSAITLVDHSGQTFSELHATMDGADASVIRSAGGLNSLALTDSDMQSTRGVAILGVAHSAPAGLDLTLSKSLLSGVSLIRDNGQSINLTANDASALIGNTSADHSTVNLNGGSVWALETGRSTLGNLGVSGSELRFADGAELTVADNVRLSAGATMMGIIEGAAMLSAPELINAGHLVKEGGGTLTLSSGISRAGSIMVSDGTLKIGNGEAVGKVELGYVDNDSMLVFDRPDTVRVNTIAGAGAVRQTGLGTTILSGDSRYQGPTLVDAGVLQLGDGGASGSVSGDVIVSTGGVLAVRRSNDVVLSNSLSGAGLITIDTDSHAFDLAASTGKAFEGVLVVGRSTFNLGGFNALSLGNATLRADTGSLITVADGEQNIKGLEIKGGELAFNATVPAQMTAESLVTTQSLNTREGGAIQVKLPTPFTPTPPGLGNTVDLLSQDDAGVGTRLVNAEQVFGSAGALTLVDQNDRVISAAQHIDIAQNDQIVAKGTYDYRLTTAPGDGLYVNYGLSRLDLQLNQTLVLAQRDSATGAAADLSAQLSGNGNIEVNAGVGHLSLSNAHNDYLGTTTVSSGTLLLEADNALGRTRALQVSSNSAVDLNGMVATIGRLEGQRGSSIDINDGSLTIREGGLSEGSLMGQGQIYLRDGNLLIDGANEALSADTTIASNAAAYLDDASGLGNGEINNHGTLVLDDAGGVLRNALSGAGTVSLTNESDVTIRGNNQAFSGLYDVRESARLWVADAADLGRAAVDNDGLVTIDANHDWTMVSRRSGYGNWLKLGDGTLTLTGSSASTGTTNVEAGTLRAGAEDTFGAAASYVVAPYARLDTAGWSQTLRSLENNGIVALLGGGAGSTLKVTGAYTSHNGILQLGTSLGADGSATDRLLLSGPDATVTGHTFIQVTNRGGLGAQTTGDGINIIAAENGAVTTAQTSKDGFSLVGGHVDAGAFEYRLYAGDAKGEGENWYLRTTSGEVLQHANYRAEVPLYSALPNLLRQSDMTMLSTLHARRGDTDGARLSNGPEAWLRTLGSNSRIRQGGASKTDSDVGFSGIQVGVDLFAHDDWTTGFYVGYLHSRARVNGRYGLASADRRFAGDLKFDTLAIAGYANYANARHQYADIVFQSSHQNITAHTPSGTNDEERRGNSVTGSMEIGQRFALSQEMWVEPQAQILVGHNNLANTSIPGASIQQDMATNVTGRLGVRFGGETDTPLGRLTPYTRVNVWHDFGGTDTMRFVTPGTSTRFSESTDYSSTELSFGSTLHLNDRTRVHAEVGKTFHNGGGSQIDSRLQGTIGVSFEF